MVTEEKNPLRVLIADDDPIIRLDLKQMLDSLGYSVICEAGDGSQALALAFDTKPDVCILDVKMPNIDGIDVAQKIADENVSPVLLLTAYSDKELVDRAKNAGIFGYLVKPFKAADLGPALEVARTRFEQNKQLKKEVSSLTEKLEARKLIEKAKGALMEMHSINECEAYRKIQVQAMQHRKTMKEIAEAVILAHSICDEPAK